MLQLRPYQQDLINRILTSYRSGNRRILTQLATGGGKSKVFTRICTGSRAKGKRILFVAHRKELLRQAAHHLVDAGIPRCEISFIQPGQPYLPLLPVQVASIDTLRARDKHPNADLIVIDEAHHVTSNSYRTKIFDAYPDSFILGFSATPIRLDGKGFSDLFQDLISGIPMSDLINQGYLSPYELWGAEESVDLKGVRTTAGDFNLGQLAQVMSGSAIVGDLVKTWVEKVQMRVGDRSTVVFAVDVEHSKLIVQQYQDAGISAAHVDGTMGGNERSAILRDFLLGKITVLSNVGIFDEGFDLATYAQAEGLHDVSADIGVVQMVRPTKSLVKYLQQVGRALRPKLGKTAIILDHAGNAHRHGYPDDPREWSLEGVRHKVEKELPPKHKECPDCGAYIANGYRICPHCGYQFSNTEIEIDETRELQLRYTPDPVAELKELLARKVPPLLAMGRFLELKPSLKQLQLGAKLTGFNSANWVWDKWKQINPDEKLSKEELRAIAKILKLDRTWVNQQLKEWA